MPPLRVVLTDPTARLVHPWGSQDSGGLLVLTGSEPARGFDPGLALCESREPGPCECGAWRIERGAPSRETVRATTYAAVFARPETS